MSKNQPKVPSSTSSVAILPETVRIVGSNPIRQQGGNWFMDTGFSKMMGLSVMYKASHLFATEPMGEELVHELMTLATEYIGAERCSWIEPKNDWVLYHVEAKGEEGWIYQVGAIPVGEAEHISPEVIQHTSNLKTIVCLGDASKEGLFTKTEYMHRIKPKSILCLPIVIESKLVGLFYLENNVFSHAFSMEKNDVLNMVAMKVYYAISGDVSKQLLQGGAPLLTDREYEVLQLIAQGHSNKEIAQQLYVTAETVKSHVRHIYEKLKVSRRIQAVAEAKRLDLIR